MPHLEELLEELTYKDAPTTAQRTFYTLVQAKHLAPLDRSPEATYATATRTAKLLAHLVEHLELKGALSAPELDEILLHVAR